MIEPAVQTRATGSPLALLAFLVPVAIVALLLVWFTGAVQGASARANVPAAAGAQANVPAAVAPPPVVLAAPPAPGAQLAPIFTPEVRYWERDILSWSAAHNLDPNLTATVVQIESCGNPQAVSPSGAQGLFQVMPFHFSAGEDMLDPQTNATRGLDFLSEMLQQSSGHVGMALVGYNGGYRAVQGSWDTWTPETRRYYRWGAGIYNDASTGMSDSPTLHDWLTSGGASLCADAHAQLGLP